MKPKLFTPACVEAVELTHYYSVVTYQLNAINKAIASVTNITIYTLYPVENCMINTRVSRSNRKTQLTNNRTEWLTPGSKAL